MRLYDWQRQFQQVVLGGAGSASLPLQRGSIDRERQLGVYSNAYQLRLTEALRGNYEALYKLLGDDDFNAMSRRFIRAHPPDTASIRWFGGDLADFLGKTAPFSEVPAIAELTRFEWALRHTVDAADGEEPTVEDLQRISPSEWGDLVFNLHPSVTVLEFHWNTPQIWQALHDDLDPPKPRAAHHYWLVYRQPDLASHWRSVDEREVLALHTWRDGGTFNDVCESLQVPAERDESQRDIAMLAATLLKTWMQEGLLVYRPERA